MTLTATPALKALAKDLTREAPRSPREKLAGYVIAPRMLDKCRATLNGTQGPYLFNQFMDQFFFQFAGINADEFSAFVATGATDEQVEEWISTHATPRERIEIVQWNNRILDTRLSEMPERFQLFMEDYIAEHVPAHRPVYHVFDIFDLEEGRL